MTTLNNMPSSHQEEWSKIFDEKFGDLGKFNSNELNLLNFDAKKLLAIKSFISSLLLSQQESIVRDLKQEIEDVASQYEHEVHGSDGVTGFNIAINHSLLSIEYYAKSKNIKI